MDASGGDGVVWRKRFQTASDWLYHQHVFYLLSTLLMLFGCYLIVLPHLFDSGAAMAELLALLGTINVYEGLVVFACGFIIRRLPQSREAALLLLIEMLFLFDMTFAASSCMIRHFGPGLIVAVSCFVLGLLKLQVLETGAQQPLFAGVKAFLIGSLALLYSLQAALAFYPSEMPQHRGVATYAIWLGLGLVIALLPKLDTEPRAARGPWLGSRSFKRAVAGLGLGLLSLQLLAQSWVQRSPLEFCFLLPPLCALLAQTEFFNVGAANWKPQRAAAVALLCASAAMAGSDFGPEAALRAGLPAMLTPMRIGFFFCAALLLVASIRERTQQFAEACGAVLLAGIVGPDPRSMTQFYEHPAAGQIAAYAAIGWAWFSLRPSYGRGAFVYISLLWLFLRGQNVPALSFELMRWGLLGLALLCFVFKMERRPWALLLKGVVFLLGAFSCRPEEARALAYFYAVAGLWCALLTRHWRIYGAVLLAYLFSAECRLWSDVAPSAGLPWGWLIVGLAFASFAAAFAITRQRLRRMAYVAALDAPIESRPPMRSSEAEMLDLKL
ncbi:MAG TPA: hypothetical protein VGP72_24815 [Planctomycetota bacterium]|jgi:hypothetical protein